LSHPYPHLKVILLYSSAYDKQQRPDETAQKAKKHDKHHHHGGGANRPSSGVELIYPRRQRDRRPSKNIDAAVEEGAVLIKQEYDYGAIYGTTFILSFGIA
jgi:hypothetical protein